MYIGIWRWGNRSGSGGGLTPTEMSFVAWLQPENILLDEEFNVKLSDFGFATKYDGKKLRGSRLDACCIHWVCSWTLVLELCGTPAYLSPEMLQCTVDFTSPGYDNKVDMWAIGVILYTMYEANCKRLFCKCLLACLSHACICLCHYVVTHRSVFLFLSVSLYLYL